MKYEWLARVTDRRFIFPYKPVGMSYYLPIQNGINMGVNVDKQQLLGKFTETLRPFETDNLMTAIQALSLKDVFTNPVVLFIIVCLFFLAVIKKSKPVLLTLFAMIGLILLLRYAMPAPGEPLTMKSLVPFAFGGLLIGGVIIYFSLIKSD